MAAKLTLKEFEENLRKIADRTPVATGESPAVKAARIKGLLANYDAFFQYYFPMYATAPCAWFQIWVANMLLSTPVIRLLLQWFRGCAKSVHANMGWPLWLKAHNQLRCMVLVGQNNEKACMLLADIEAQLRANQRYINDYGEQFNYGHWEEGRLVTKDGCSFHALGFGQSPRGLRNGAHRPDYMVLDDVDTQELSNNPARVARGVDWVQDDLMGCFDTGMQRFIVANNTPFASSIMGSLIAGRLAGAVTGSVKKLWRGITAAGAFYYQHAGYWHHLRVNAVDDTGAPAWPQKYTRQYWQGIKADKSTRSWLREYMNTPVVEGSVFKPQWLHYKPALPLNQYTALVCYADPSWKATAHSDYKAVVLIGLHGREWHILKAFVRQCTIGAMVQYMYDIYEAMDITQPHRPFALHSEVPVAAEFYIEANAHQDLHLTDFLTEGEMRGYQLPIRPDYRAKPDKISRIESISPFFERGHVFISEAEKNDPDMKRAIEHLLAFEPGTKTPDDFPDALEGAMWHCNRRSLVNTGTRILGKRVLKGW